MFDSNIRLYGKHAAILKKYAKDKQAEDQYKFEVSDNAGNLHSIYIFDTMVQAYMVAAMIGIINQKHVDIDTGKEPTASIFSEVLIKTENRRLLERIVRFMILTETTEENIDGKVKEAFSMNNKENVEKKVTNYVRFGLEEIDNYFKDCTTHEDVANAIISLKNDYYIY